MAASDQTLLHELRELLNHLPDELPLPNGNSRYQAFLSFGLDTDLMDKIGDEVGVVSDQFKGVFGWKTHTTGDGIRAIEECSKPICAVVDVLARFLKVHPGDAVLRKWALDIADGARKQYRIYGKAVPEAAKPGAITGIVTEDKDSDGDDEDSDSDDDDEVTFIKTSQQPAKKVSAKGHAALDRVLKHAVRCNVIDPELRRLAREASADDSLGHALEQEEREKAAEEHASKKRKTISEDDGLDSDPEPSLSGEHFDIGSWTRKAGKVKDAETRGKFQTKVDHIIMRLVCVRGMVPHLIDSSEWKELMVTLNPVYQPTSSSQFADKHIPAEANHVRRKQIKQLAKLDNLTVTFDGNNTRRDSIYFTHITTPLRETYFVDGHVGSDERHTTKWVTDKILKTVMEVGRDRIAATCSDSTSITKGARRELCKEVTTILDLCDACHHIHNTIGNISKLPEFKPMITMLKAIVAYFGRSVHARAMLRKQLDAESGDEKIGALQKIGKTRFGTFWMAAVSLSQSLSKIRDLVIKGDIKFKKSSIQDMFVNRGSPEYQEFEHALLHYIAIVEPFICSLWSLESSTANATDVSALRTTVPQLDHFAIHRSLWFYLTASASAHLLISLCSYSPSALAKAS
ncbi:hypothetical protein EVG20_g6072 [Dentipellis fragilis]|uniref:Uncharacterized protein n=1 Tax=Dentipellis fragilis TaxID=205917 RepID=A0A4Y9YNP2_9AGAM|nr:hypothetical protein EVG20_g6072 [Dentipellis fragilis]